VLGTDIRIGIAFIVLAAAMFVVAVGVVVLIVRRGFKHLGVKGLGVQVEVDAVERVAQSLDVISKEVQTNGGSTLKDAAVRTEAKVDQLITVVDRIAQRLDDAEARLMQAEEALTTPNRRTA
jgi:hypothetical protein